MYILTTLKINHIMGRHELTTEILNDKPILTDKALYPDFIHSWNAFYNLTEIPEQPIVESIAPEDEEIPEPKPKKTKKKEPEPTE